MDLDQLEVSGEWNFAETKENRVHKIHSYPAKFPAFMTTMAISCERGQGVNVGSIGDIFCGCGTVAYEARKANIKFWGCDINPVATLIAQGKSEPFNIRKLRLDMNLFWKS